MTWFNRMAKWGILLLLITVWVSGSANAAEVVVALNADIRSTTPGVNRDSNTDGVMMHVVEGLVAYREDGTVGPMLAERIDVSDDGLTYTFTLREGIKFHNGAPLTAQEVVWSWMRYLNPETKWRCLKDFDGSKDLNVESVEAVDDRTVRLRINHPSSLFLVQMARPDCGATSILHPDSIAADGSWAGPIGAGPFKIESWKKGQSITLAKFQDYASRKEPRDGLTGGKDVLVDQVKFVVIPDGAAANAALLSGEVQVIPDIPTSTKKEVDGHDNIRIDVQDSLGISGILFQTRDPLLGKLEMRQAIAAALDMDQLVAAVTEGISKRNNSVVPRAVAYHTDVQKKGFTYDLEKAKALLKKAGYNGEPIVMLTNKRYESCYNVAVFAQSMLRMAGINVKLEVMEWGTQLDRYLSGKYQMMAFLYSARLDPALGFDSIMGDKDLQPKKPWDNPDAQKLMIESMQVSDRAKRQALFDELHRMFIAEAPMIVLYNGPEIATFSNKVEGYKAFSLGFPRLWGVSLSD